MTTTPDRSSVKPRIPFPTDQDPSKNLQQRRRRFVNPQTNAKRTNLLQLSSGLQIN